MNYCISCRSALVNTAFNGYCPRCGTDNRSWVAWDRAGLEEHVGRFFLGSAWGWLALASLLLPPIAWVALNFDRPGLGIAVLFVSWLVSVTGLALLFFFRHELWLAELACSVSPGFQPGLLSLGGAGFLVFIVVAARLAWHWIVPLWSGFPANSPPVVDAPQGVVIGLAFVIQALAAGIYGLYAYGCWLLRTMPAPVFLAKARLLELVEQAARGRIQAEPGWEEATAIQVVESERTGQAGLRLRVRAERPLDKVLEGHFLKAIQHWRVNGDRWGQLVNFTPEGPLEYAIDPDRPYMPAAPARSIVALSGDIIFPTKRTLSPEEVFLRAFTASEGAST